MNPIYCLSKRFLVYPWVCVCVLSHSINEEKQEAQREVLCPRFYSKCMNTTPQFSFRNPSTS